MKRIQIRINILTVFLIAIIGIANGQSFSLFQKSGLMESYELSETRSITFPNSSVNITRTNGEIVSIPFVDMQKIIFQNPNSSTTSTIESVISLKVYPNPATDFINIVLGSNQSVRKINLRLSTINGQIIYNQNYANRDDEIIQVNLSNLNKGIYILYVFDGKNTQIEKIIKK